MQRTETLALSVDATKGVIANVYGFVARRKDAAVPFPLVAFVKYAGENTERTIVVLEGEPVAGVRLMERVRLATTSEAGDVYVWCSDEVGELGGGGPRHTGGTSVEMLAGGANGAALRTARKSRTIYDSGDVPGGAQVQTPILDLSDVEALIVYARNGDNAVARPFVADFLLEDGSTILLPAGSMPASPVAIASFWRATWAPGASPASPFTQHIPGIPPPRLRLTLQAGGTSIGRVTVQGR